MASHARFVASRVVSRARCDDVVAPSVSHSRTFQPKCSWHVGVSGPGRDPCLDDLSSRKDGSKAAVVCVSTHASHG